MKNSIKVYLIIGTVLVITGLTTLAAAAGAAGGSFEYLEEEFREWYWKYRTSAIEDGGEVFFDVSENTTIEAEVIEEYSVSNSSYVYGQDFNSVDINVEFANLVIEGGDEFNIEWDSRGSFIEYEVDNDGILKVTQENDNRIGYPNKTKVKITLPEYQRYEMISIYTNAGNIKMEGLFLEALSIEALAGNIKLEEITAASAFIKSAAGNIDFQGDISEFANVELSAGNVSFTLKGSPQQYDYALRASAGNLSVDGEKYNRSMIGGEYTYDNGTGRKIDISSSAGNIKVEFEN